MRNWRYLRTRSAASGLFVGIVNGPSSSSCELSSEDSWHGEQVTLSAVCLMGPLDDESLSLLSAISCELCIRISVYTMNMCKTSTRQQCYKKCKNSSMQHEVLWTAASSGHSSPRMQRGAWDGFQMKFYTIRISLNARQRGGFMHTPRASCTHA
jgi:hypothetical protein